MNLVLPYLKTYAALIGSVATALLAVYAADTEVGKALTVVAVIATAVATWAVPNVETYISDGEHRRDPNVGTDGEGRPFPPAV